MNITFHLFQKFPAEPFEFLRSFKNSNLYVPKILQILQNFVRIFLDSPRD